MDKNRSGTTIIPAAEPNQFRRGHCSFRDSRRLICPGSSTRWKDVEQSQLKPSRSGCPLQASQHKVDRREDHMGDAMDDGRTRRQNSTQVWMSGMKAGRDAEDRTTVCRQSLPAKVQVDAQAGGRIPLKQEWHSNALGVECRREDRLSIHNCGTA